MIDVPHARPAAAVIGPGNPGAGVNGQRERIKGPAAAGDRHISRGDWVAAGLGTRAG